MSNSNTRPYRRHHDVYRCECSSGRVRSLKATVFFVALRLLTLPGERCSRIRRCAFPRKRRDDQPADDTAFPRKSHVAGGLFKCAKTRLAAAMVASISAAECAADKNPASYADGAR